MLDIQALFFVDRGAPVMVKSNKPSSQPEGGLKGNLMQNRFLQRMCSVSFENFIAFAVALICVNICAPVFAEPQITQGISSPALDWADVNTVVNSTGSSGADVYFQWAPSAGGITKTAGPIHVPSGGYTYVTNRIFGLQPFTSYTVSSYAVDSTGTAQSQASGFLTVPRFNSVNSYANWTALQMSRNGKILAATSNNVVCISTNFGVTFAPTVAPGSILSVSYNGEVMISADGDQIVYSTNAGALWETNAAPGAYVFNASASGNLITGFLPYFAGQTIYASTNFGASWYSSSIYPYGPQTVAISDDGSISYAAIIYARINTAYVSTSTNMGASWNVVRSIPSQYSLNAFACSPDGYYSVLSANQFVFSTNEFASYYADPTLVAPYNEPFSVISFSGDDKTILLSGGGGQTAYSPDSGVTWYTPSAPTSIGAVTISSNGDTMVGLSSAIYISLPPPSTPAALSMLSYNPANGPSLGVSGVAGYTYTIQRSHDLASWVNIATLVATNGTAFYTDQSAPASSATYYRAVWP